MSVLIGIICPEAIVLSADSQITDLTTGEFSYVDKISTVKFFPNDHVLVAQGGLWQLTNRIVEIMREKARAVKITSAQSVTQIVEDSIRAAKFPLDEKQQEYVNQCPSGLLIAFYVGKSPHLYTVDCYGSGIVCAAERHYATMGAGSAVLASYLLNEYTLPKSHSDFAIAASIFATAKVKEHQKALCGGDTIIKRLEAMPMYQLDIQSIGYSHQVPQELVNMTEMRLVNFDEKTKKTRNKNAFAILKKVSSQLWKKHLKQVEAETNRLREHARIHNPVTGIMGASAVYEHKPIENKGEKK
jgi:20S proteasome alpha/beta subunit